VQADTVQPNPSDPQQLNRFSYVSNSPARFSDPTGHYIEEGSPLDPPGTYYQFLGPGNRFGGMPQRTTLIANARNGSQPSDAEWFAAATLPVTAPAAGVLLGGALEAVEAGASLVGAGVQKLVEGAGAGCAAVDCVGKIRTGVNTVCGYVEEGVTKYYGITNDFARRSAEQLRALGGQIERIAGLTQLSRSDARAVEQVLIEYTGLPNLLNKINSIAQSNPIYPGAIERGNEILRSIGFFGR
jgi:hypothetical protein